MIMKCPKCGEEMTRVYSTYYDKYMYWFCEYCQIFTDNNGRIIVDNSFESVKDELTYPWGENGG